MHGTVKLSSPSVLILIVSNIEVVFLDFNYVFQWVFVPLSLVPGIIFIGNEDRFPACTSVEPWGGGQHFRCLHFLTESVDSRTTKEATRQVANELSYRMLLKPVYFERLVAGEIGFAFDHFHEPGESCQ